MADLLPIPRDVNGTPIYGNADQTSGGLTTIDTVHKRIHDGEFYSTGFVDTALVTTGDLEVLIVITSPIHVRVGVTSSVLAETFLYETPTNSSAGTAMAVANRNRLSSNTQDAVFTSGPTITGDGTLLFDDIVPGASGGLGLGGLDEEWVEWILAAGDYLIRVTNNSGGTGAVSVNIDFYQDE